MKRGILELSKDQFNVLFKTVDQQRIANTPLQEKLNAAADADNDKIRILLSEDEFDFLYDEIAIPSDNEDPLMKNVRIAFRRLLEQFRNE